MLTYSEIKKIKKDAKRCFKDLVKYHENNNTDLEHYLFNYIPNYKQNIEEHDEKIQLLNDSIKDHEYDRLWAETMIQEIYNLIYKKQ